jgi:hypothetical protein
LSTSIKPGTNYPWVKEIPVCSNKGLGPLQRGDNHKNGVGSFKNLPLQNQRANFNQTWQKSSLGEGDLSLITLLQWKIIAKD